MISANFVYPEVTLMLLHLISYRNGELKENINIGTSPLHWGLFRKKLYFQILLTFLFFSVKEKAIILTLLTASFFFFVKIRLFSLLDKLGHKTLELAHPAN